MCEEPKEERDLRQIADELGLKDIDLIEICDSCFLASCWQGEFMCENAVNSGTCYKTVGNLIQLNKEHPSYWLKTKLCN